MTQILSRLMTDTHAEWLALGFRHGRAGLKVVTIVLAVAMVCVGAGVVFAEVVVAPRAADVARPAAEPVSKRSAHEAAVMDCESMWDRGTHMTRKEWSLTCRRVQDRIQQFELR